MEVALGLPPLALLLLELLESCNRGVWQRLPVLYLEVSLGSQEQDVSVAVLEIAGAQPRHGGGQGVLKNLDGVSLSCLARS